MTLQEAIAEISLYAQTDAFPALSPEQVSDLAVKNMRARVWTASLLYLPGEKVQPTTRNGHFYKCIEPGISALAEPVWTLREKSQNRDALQLVWEECGLDLDGNLYNTRNAIHAAWLLKASIAARDFDVSIDNQKWNRSQIYAHCLEMARAWSPFD